MSNPYPIEVRKHALRMLVRARAGHRSDHYAEGHDADRLGVNPGRCGCGRSAPIPDTGREPGTMTEAAFGGQEREKTDHRVGGSER